MGWFEENPLALVVFIIATVEGWGWLKRRAAEALRSRRELFAVVPRGAFPSYAHGIYARDNAFYRNWDHIARDRDTFARWMERHVVNCRDHAEYLRTLEAA